jgi:hypothetical protein
MKKYGIECHGTVYGPFDNDVLAAAWAGKHCAGLAWRLRELHAPEGGML